MPELGLTKSSNPTSWLNYIMLNLVVECVDYSIMSTKALTELIIYFVIYYFFIAGVYDIINKVESNKQIMFP